MKGADDYGDGRAVIRLAQNLDGAPEQSRTFFDADEA